MTNDINKTDEDIEEHGISHTERIYCPECGSICEAEVQHTFPWNSYVHVCDFCQYIIMESEWEEVEP